MPYKDPKKAKENKKRYYQNNKKQLLKYRKNWAKTHKEQRKESCRKYRKNHPECGREYYKLHKKHYNEQNALWKTKHPEAVKKWHAKRRDLGFITLNKSFEGSVAHHIDKMFVVYIPKELHISVWHCLGTGQGMDEINNKVFEWLDFYHVS